MDIHSSIASWWAHLAYIPQSIYLIDDTIQANVAFGVLPESVNLDYLMQVLEGVELKALVEQMKDGVLTNIGERGVRLSADSGSGSASRVHCISSRNYWCWTRRHRP